MSLGGNAKIVTIQDNRIHHTAIVEAIKQTTSSLVKGGA
jgi:hypothetical protein